MEGGPGDVKEVEGGEVGELLEGGGFGEGIGGADLTTDLGDGAGDDGGFEGWLGTEGFD